MPFGRKIVSRFRVSMVQAEAVQMVGPAEPGTIGTVGAQAQERVDRSDRHASGTIGAKAQRRRCGTRSGGGKSEVDVGTSVSLHRHELLLLEEERVDGRCDRLGVLLLHEELLLKE